MLVEIATWQTSVHFLIYFFCSLVKNSLSVGVEEIRGRLRFSRNWSGNRDQEISMINVRHLAGEFLFRIQCGARLNLVKAMLSPFKWYHEESVLRYAILALIKMRCLITPHAEHSWLRPFLLHCKVKGEESFRSFVPTRKLKEKIVRWLMTQKI